MVAHFPHMLCRNAIDTCNRLALDFFVACVGHGAAIRLPALHRIPCAHAKASSHFGGDRGIGGSSGAGTGPIVV